MNDFKVFLDAIVAGEARQDLFLYPDKVQQQAAIRDMFNAAGPLGLCPIIRRSNSTIIFDNAVASIRIAHAHIDRELRGIIWTEVHGLDTLDEFENAEAMKHSLLAQVR